MHSIIVGLKCSWSPLYHFLHILLNNCNCQAVRLKVVLLATRETILTSAWELFLQATRKTLLTSAWEWFLRATRETILKYFPATRGRILPVYFLEQKMVDFTGKNMYQHELLKIDVKMTQDHEKSQRTVLIITIEGKAEFFNFTGKPNRNQCCKE